jgi:ABC-type branched-subunit amino acid transport system substrate-binding protein
MVAVRIGLLIAQEGAAGLWAPSAEACAKLAILEINMAGGLFGKEVELLPINIGTSMASAAEAATMAVDVEHVSAIVGMFPSYARRPIARAIGDRVPFIYTPQFEGLSNESGVVTTGETSRELLGPAIRWLVEKKRGQRFFLCGSDYVWPRVSFATAKEFIRDAGGIVTGEVFTPLESHDFIDLLSTIRATNSDVVLPYFLGSDAIHFNRAFGETGMASKILRFSSAIDETILCGLNENATENLFVASAYFSTMRSHNNGAFLERYHNVYGESPPPANGFGQSCYEGIHCLASLAEAAHTMRPGEVHRAIGRTVQRRTARGNDRMPIAGGSHPIHVARVDGYNFTVLSGI